MIGRVEIRYKDRVFKYKCPKCKKWYVAWKGDVRKIPSDEALTKPCPHCGYNPWMIPEGG